MKLKFKFKLRHLRFFKWGNDKDNRFNPVSFISQSCTFRFRMDRWELLARVRDKKWMDCSLRVLNCSFSFSFFKLCNLGIELFSCLAMLKVSLLNFLKNMLKMEMFFRRERPYLMENFSGSYWS